MSNNEQILKMYKSWKRKGTFVILKKMSEHDKASRRATDWARGRREGVNLHRKGGKPF